MKLLIICLLLIVIIVIFSIIFYINKKENYSSELSVIGSNKNELTMVSFQDFLKIIYPIGSIYITTSTNNPGSYMPGTTWEQYSKGRTIVGSGGNFSNIHSESGDSSQGGSRYSQLPIDGYGGAIDSSLHLSNTDHEANKGKLLVTIDRKQANEVYYSMNTIMKDNNLNIPLEKQYIILAMWKRIS
jgi:hypothetical protein